MTDEDKAKVFEHIARKWTGEGACNRCEQRNWDDPSFISLPFVNGVNSLPTAALVCRNCGNTELVNLLVAGCWPLKG